MPLPPYMTGQPDGAPTPAPAPPRRAGVPSSGGPGIPRARTAAVAVVVLLGVGATGWWATREEATPPDALVAAPPVQEKAACLDASRSVDRDGELSQVAARELAARVGSLHDWKMSVPTFEPAAPAAGVNLQVRVVRDDSYATSGADRFAGTFAIPSVRGLAVAKPLSTDPGAEGFDEDYAVVSREQTDAREAQAAASQAITTLTKRRSTGSDITGCVAAALESAPAGAAPSILIVSDLQDSHLTTSGGGERSFAGDFSSARLTIVAACPGGRQESCDARYEAFLSRMEKLGIGRDSITAVRPEQVGAAIDGWLATA